MLHLAATPQSASMKISTVLILVAPLALFAGCNSLDNPITNLFHGHDARVYNPQTGEWEYPKGKGTPAPQKSAAVASALSATPAPQGGGHPTNWVEAHNVDSSPNASHVASNASAPGSPATAAPAAPAPPVPTPAPPRPERATGRYNPTTGKIDWQAGGYIPTSTPPPAPTKHWWWPFGKAQTGGYTASTTSTATSTTAPTKHWWWPF